MEGRSDFLVDVLQRFKEPVRVLNSQIMLEVFKSSVKYVASPSNMLHKLVSQRPLLPEKICIETVKVDLNERKSRLKNLASNPTNLVRPLNISRPQPAAVNLDFDAIAFQVRLVITTHE
jgi:hypothetical protein